MDGYLTNVNTSAGTYVNAGEELLALVDSSSFWVAAYFKETQISNVKPGDKVKITLMGHPRQPFEGVVESTGWAVFIQDGSTVQLIPEVAQTIDWVQLPQRFPSASRLPASRPCHCASVRPRRWPSTVTRGLDQSCDCTLPRRGAGGRSP